MVEPVRKYELDWLRVLAILAVFVFHSARFFDPMDWHVKNPATYPFLALPMMFFVVWGMPLLFVISGASVFYALKKRNAGPFLKERAVRLLVPLAFGIFTHIMWQVYLERLTHGRFKGSFIEFIPHYFDGLYGFGGNFAWMGLHLWYLELLFVFSLFFLPLFIWLRRGSGQGVLSRVAGFLSFPGGVYLLAIPLWLLLVLPNPDSVWTARVFGGWGMVQHAVFFFGGFLLVSDERLYDSVRRLRWVSLAAGSAIVPWLAVMYSRSGEPAYGTPYFVQILTLFGLSAWLWVLAIIGFSAQRLRHPKPFLAYANEAVLPFYILHQTALLTLGFFIVRQPIPGYLKWALIVLLSLGFTVGIYEFLVRRFGVLRFLFGMRPAAKGFVVR